MFCLKMTDDVSSRMCYTKLNFIIPTPGPFCQCTTHIKLDNYLTCIDIILIIMLVVTANQFNTDNKCFNECFIIL